ncbi:MAG: LysE family translocator [Thermomicrobiales bacterium]
MNVAEAIGLLGYGMGVGIVLAAPVGPINVEILRRGLLIGPKAGWLVGIGAMTADTIFATIIVSGVSGIADRPALRVPLFLAGAAMLGWIGTASLREARRGAIDLDARARGASRSFGTGFLMAALNPMGIVYWLSVGSALVAEAVSRVGRAGSPVLVGGVFLGIFCWVTGLSLAIRAGRRWVNAQALRWITGLSGAILLGFALWFAVQGLRGLHAL